jgi:hypothetical protein
MTGKALHPPEPALRVWKRGPVQISCLTLGKVRLRYLHERDTLCHVAETADPPTASGLLPLLRPTPRRHFMLRTMTEMRRYTIGATDGDIGSLHDLFFDDKSWTIRYLVVDTGTWLSGRRVLISPMSVVEPDGVSERFHVRLTRAQMESSPHVDTDKPVSRQHEIEMSRYYGYPYYWTGPYRWGMAPYAAPVAVPPRPSAVEEEVMARERASADPNLRSVRAVTGHYIVASDGEIGHVEDFLVDDRAWAIRYMIVDTRNWWPGKKVLVSPEWISSVSWADATVSVDLTRDGIRNAPEYDPSCPLDREDEARLFGAYRRPAYWDTEDRPWAA